MLEHGGRLRIAAERYAIPLEQWVDLSTGINPYGWVPKVPPATVWQRLPEELDGLEQAAANYYGCRDLLPVAGSQAAIQRLPRLRDRSTIGLLSPSYSEHRQAWLDGGHRVVDLTANQIDQRLDELDVLVICNPNNPDGRLFDNARLLDWHQRLVGKGGWLIVDEAFMDPTPGLSLVTCDPLPGLIILRSLGKFFGLAGVRVGFVVAEQVLLARLREQLGPWSIAGPSRWVARQALSDRAWQNRTRERLPEEVGRLRRLIATAGFEPIGASVLFQYFRHEASSSIAVEMARRGLLVRQFKAESALRIGLPGSETAWQRLGEALSLLAR